MTLDFEDPSAFYLGHGLASPDASSDQPILLRAGDLTTHAVCVGMTGSGKTGLGIGLLEEAALDGIPSIIVDPKGDMGNLLLTFPNLAPEDFQPWVSADQAARKGLSITDYAAEVAATWHKGLAQAGQGPDRIARLRQAAEFRIYTPGSEAGLPVAVLRTLTPPADQQGLNEEDVRDQIQGAVSAILALAGIEADPMRSREHILITNLVLEAWRSGRKLELTDLIRGVHKPPFTQLGVFDLETFYPENDRMELALALNAIVASPAFSAWLKGDDLNVERLLWDEAGKPRVNIFSIAHLDDRERTFFVALLMQQVVSWMRSQSGSAGLRALLYFDEIFGYLPPYPKNPPTKRPLLTLLKQARAVGLGLILATQNPVDLDYKALSNAGVWFVGRLQTEQDKLRLLDGLMGVQTRSTPLDRGRLDELISALPGRVFLLHNVHRTGPNLFRTRWVMSYLAGPLTREQVEQLMSKNRPAADETTPRPDGPPTFCSTCGAALLTGARFCGQCGAKVPAVDESASQAEDAFKQELQTEAPSPIAGYTSEPPVLPPAVKQYFLPAEAEASATGKEVVYRPVVLAQAVVSVVDQRRGVDYQKGLLLALEAPPGGHAAQWESAEALSIGTDRFASVPMQGAHFAEVPESANTGPKFTALRKSLADHLYVNTRVSLLYNPELDVYSKVGEEQLDYEQRVKAAADKERDEAVAKLTDRYQIKIDRIEDKIDRQQRSLAEDEAEYGGRKREEALSAAESVLGFLTGRRASTALSKASRKRRMTDRARMEIDESKAEIKDLEQELEEVKREMQEEIQELNEHWAEIAEKQETFLARPRRADIRIDFIGLGWRPTWHDA